MNRFSITLTILFDSLNNIHTGISDNKVIELLIPIHYNSKAERINCALLSRKRHYLTHENL